MSAYLNGLAKFSVNADIDFEIIDLNGQKLQLSSVSTAVIERPGKLYVTKKGMFADAELIFNGKVLTVNGQEPQGLMPSLNPPAPSTTPFGLWNWKRVWMRRERTFCYPTPTPFSWMVLRAAFTWGLPMCMALNAIILLFGRTRFDWQTMGEDR